MIRQVFPGVGIFAGVAGLSKEKSRSGIYPNKTRSCVPIRVTRSVIPSLFTTMNLFSGFVAIIKATEGEYVVAAWFIVLSVIFDGLDGAMARLTKTSSEFGVELDSLADVVSFGIAPSFMLYSAFFYQWEAAGMIIAGLPAMCGALRLARFNVQLTGLDKDYFLGLPIPAGALTTISYLVFHHLSTDAVPSDAIRPALIAIITIGTSLLMVSTIRYDTFPKPIPTAIKGAPVKFVLALLGVIAIIVTKGKAIFPFMALYLVYGVFRQFYHFLRHEEEEDTMEALEETPFDI
ncbi:MAG: CDP-diacylglycerol--serine O-phosphatidyltransferase [Chlorobi bacterium]|nr:CDP-diacylglycerol--serine O-phosphatidyltransferase [Chlorobiota bacterium]